MSRKRQTLEIGGANGGSWSFFYKDETGDLGREKETLFYQPWGFRPPADRTKEKAEHWPSMDYDERWRLTATLYPHCIGNGQVKPLRWPELKIALWWWNWAQVA